MSTKTCARCGDPLESENETFCELCRYTLRQVLESRRESQKRYFASEKGKAALTRYQNSEKGKEAKRRYAKSEKGKEARKRYNERLAESLRIAREGLRGGKSE